MTNALPPLDPAVVAAGLELLPSRLLKRAEKLAADSVTWDISTDNEPEVLRVRIGSTTVTLKPDGLHCDCLLSPKCAHIGAVCVAAPVGEATTTAGGAPEDAGSLGSDSSQGLDSSHVPTTEQTPSATDAAWAKELPPPAQIAEVVASAREIINDIFERGLGQLSMTRHTQLLACVQKARVVGLPRMERALTALATNSQHLRLGQPVGRNDATLNTLRVSFLCHLLDKDPADRQAIGQARRSYTTLDTQSGVGAGSFTPLYAEPIATASGFAGVSIALATTTGKMYSVTKTPPGTADSVPGVWHGALRLGDLHCSHAQLARKTLLITGGRSAADGRIGSGRGVRAALGKTVTLDMVRSIPLTDGLLLIQGTVKAIALKGIILETPHSGTTALSFSVSARKTQLPGLVDALTRYLESGDELTFTCLVRNATILCIWPEHKLLNLPEEFGGRVFPGLDVIPRPAVPIPPSDDTRTGADRDKTSGFGRENPAQRSISEIIEPWLQRVTFGGAQAVNSRINEANLDTRLLNQLAAPFAATLLQRFSEQPAQPEHVLALAAYIKKI